MSAWLLHGFQILFFLGGFFIFYGNTNSKDIRNLVGSGVYCGSAVISYFLVSWWPLITGFVLLSILRLMGFDPSDD